MFVEISVNNFCMDDGLDRLDRLDRSYMFIRDRRILVLSDIYVYCSFDKRVNCLFVSCVKILNGIRFYLLEKSYKFGFYNFFFKIISVVF